MFHVEHYHQETLMKYPGISTKDKTDILEQYGHLIHETNNRFNLTGLKTIEDITNTLIISSLIPFSAINVPRGTLIADIGTGAGIPGIPLSILIKSATFTLFDATNKKIEFITDVITKLGIDNARAINGRIEELGRDELYRETFDWVVTRAMAEPFMATELGAPLLKTGGYLYLYASEKQVVFHD